MVVRLGVIGYGGRLQHLLSMLLKTSDALEFTALYDPDPSGAYPAQTRLHSSERALLEDPSLDWILIGSPNADHARQAITALQAGKHVFCEKPLATTVEDARAIAQAVERSGRLFLFGLVLRYSPFYQRMKVLLDAGAIGRLVSFEFNETLSFNHGGYIMGNWRRLRAKAGSHMLEKCCHDLDLACWLADSLPKRVASFGGLNVFTPQNKRLAQALGPDAQGRPAYEGWPASARVDPFEGDKDIVDNQVVIIEFASGVRASFHTSLNAALTERRFYLLGEEGALRGDVLTGQIELGRIGHNTKPTVENTGASGMHGDGDQHLIEDLRRAMLLGEPPKVSVQQGVISTIVAVAIDQARRTGTVVVV